MPLAAAVLVSITSLPLSDNECRVGAGDSDSIIFESCAGIKDKEGKEAATVACAFELSSLLSSTSKASAASAGAGAGASAGAGVDEEGKEAAIVACALELSSTNVTGPSLTRPTAIISPKAPSMCCSKREESVIYYVHQFSMFFFLLFFGDVEFVLLLFVGESTATTIHMR